MGHIHRRKRNMTPKAMILKTTHHVKTCRDFRDDWNQFLLFYKKDREGDLPKVTNVGGNRWYWYSALQSAGFLLLPLVYSPAHLITGTRNGGFAVQRDFLWDALGVGLSEFKTYSNYSKGLQYLWYSSWKPLSNDALAV